MMTKRKQCNDMSIFRHDFNTPWLFVAASWASTIFAATGVATGFVAIAGQLIIDIFVETLSKTNPSLSNGCKKQAR